MMARPPARTLIPVFTAISLLVASATSAEPGLTEEFIVAGFSDDQVMLDRSRSDVFFATADDPEAASTVAAPSPRARAESGEVQTRDRRLFAFLLIVATAPRR